MGFLLALAGFLAAITLLVFIHEYGHYKTALLCGVKVKRFSIGFGKPIFSRVDKRGVEWVVGWAPFGGYVLMLDGRNEPIPPGEEALSFDNASVWRRFAIVIAGPLTNLAFAILAWGAVFAIGSESPRAYMGVPIAGSIAAKGGFEGRDLVTSVNGSPAASLEDAALLMAQSAIGREPSVAVQVQRDGVAKSLSLDFSAFDAGAAGQDLLGAIGWSSPGPQIPPSISRVLPGSPADRAGFKAGDTVLALNGASVQSVSEMSALVGANASQPIKASVKGADGALRELTVIPEIPKEAQGASARPRIGVGFDATLTPAQRSAYMISVQRGPWEALKKSAERCYAVSAMSLRAIGAMITGKSGSEGLSGPVGIAQQAGGAASAGLVPFISFLALLSLSLFLMNILPLPALDGGHLVLFTIEALRGRPLAASTQHSISKIGFSMLMALMVFAVYNDLSKFFR